MHEIILIFIWKALQDTNLPVTVIYLVHEKTSEVTDSGGHVMVEPFYLHITVTEHDSHNMYEEQCYV